MYKSYVTSEKGLIWLHLNHYTLSSIEVVNNNYNTVVTYEEVETLARKSINKEEIKTAVVV